MAALFDDALGSHRAPALAFHGVPVTYRTHAGVSTEVTAVRGADQDLGSVIQRPYHISVDEQVAVAEGEQITDGGEVWTVVDATTRPIGGLHGLLTERPRLHPASAPAGA